MSRFGRRSAFARSLFLLSWKFASEQPIAESAPEQARPDREPPLLPALNSFWVQIQGDQVVEVCRVNTDPTTGTTIMFRVPGHDHLTLSSREFFRQFRINTPEKDDVQTLPLHEPERRSRPLKGDTWWSWASKKPVMVLRLDTNSAGIELVRFKGADTTDTTLSVEDFMEKFQLEPPIPDCQPGEEWVDSQSKVLRIREVDMVRRRIAGLTKAGEVSFIPLATFVASFTRLERLSIHDRILNAEDDD